MVQYERKLFFKSFFYFGSSIFYILYVYSRVRWFSNFSSAVYRYLELSLYFSSAVHWYLEISLYIFSVFSENNEKRLIHAQE